MDLSKGFNFVSLSIRGLIAKIDTGNPYIDIGGAIVIILTLAIAYRIMRGKPG